MVNGGCVNRPFVGHVFVSAIASKISVTLAWLYVSSECPNPLDARSARTGRLSATTGASTGCMWGHSLVTYSQISVTVLILEAIVYDYQYAGAWPLNGVYALV